MRVTTTTYFIVRDRITGGAYLTNRKNRTNQNQQAYRWTKAQRSAALRFGTYDSARKAATRYGGCLVRCVKVAIKSRDGYKTATLQEVV